MSALVEAIAAAWTLASAETRETIGLLVRSAWGINRALAVPAVEPGFSRPEIDALGATSSATDVRVALDAYEVLAARFEGLPLDALFAVRSTIAASWDAIDTLARDRAPLAMRLEVETLRGAYDALVRGGWGLGSTLTDSHARAWLYARLARLQRPQESNGKWWLLLFGAALYYASRSRGGDS